MRKIITKNQKKVNIFFTVAAFFKLNFVLILVNTKYTSWRITMNIKYKSISKIFF